jgi:hypothetical protein
MPEQVPKRNNSPFLTKDELAEWLRLTPWRLRKLTSNPEFLERCGAFNVAEPGSQRRELRFPAKGVAECLGIPEYATPQSVEAAA